MRRTHETIRREALEQQIRDTIATVSAATPGRRFLVLCHHVRDRKRLEEGLREGLTTEEFDRVQIDWSPVLGE